MKAIEVIYDIAEAIGPGGAVELIKLAVKKLDELGVDDAIHNAIDTVLGPQIGDGLFEVLSSLLEVLLTGFSSSAINAALATFGAALSAGAAAATTVVAGTATAAVGAAVATTTTVVTAGSVVATGVVVATALAPIVVPVTLGYCIYKWLKD